MKSFSDKNLVLKKLPKFWIHQKKSFDTFDEDNFKNLLHLPKEKRKIYSPENIIGITYENHVPDLWSNLLIIAKSDKIKKLFKLNYVEKKLQVFDKTRKKLIVKNNPSKNKDKILKGKGLLFILLDNSFI